MNIQTIETIIAVFNNPSFLEASYALNYTAAVVSKHIANAEKELGIKLFVRGNKAHKVTPTAECESIIYNFISIKEAWERASDTVSMLKSLNHDQPLRIGTTNKRWSYGEVELISDFIIQNPDISVEQMHGYSSDLLKYLRAGKLDCAFLVVQGEADDISFMHEFKNENDCDFFLIKQISQMYLAISDEWAKTLAPETTLDNLKDFDIVFNSDKMALTCGNTMMPFIELSQKYGFKLKSTFLDTQDASTYRLATKLKLAIPTPNNDFNYPGISFVKLKDWESCISSYFVTMNSNTSQKLHRFKELVIDYSKSKNY